jgi:transposase
VPKTHPTYDDDFRRNAVNLLLSSGHALTKVASDLGISANSLRHWRNRALHPGAGGKAVAVGAAAAGGAGVDPALEIRRLHKEVEYLRRQRDILKKAMSILSEDPQLGMR